DNWRPNERIKVTTDHSIRPSTGEVALVVAGSSYGLRTRPLLESTRRRYFGHQQNGTLPHRVDQGTAQPRRVVSPVSSTTTTPVSFDLDIDTDVDVDYLSDEDDKNRTTDRWEFISPQESQQSATRKRRYSLSS